MSLRIRFRFDGKCSLHPRYNPEKDGRPQHKDCPGCEGLWVIHLYTGIARRKAEAAEGLLVSRSEISARGGIVGADEGGEGAAPEQDNNGPSEAGAGE